MMDFELSPDALALLQVVATLLRVTAFALACILCGTTIWLIRLLRRTIDQIERDYR